MSFVGRAVTYDVAPPDESFYPATYVPIRPYVF
jgi:hypothetical protein